MESAKVIGFCKYVLPDNICRKIPYATKQQAYSVIKRNKGRRNRKEATVYFCESCKAWHLTSQRR